MTEKTEEAGQAPVEAPATGRPYYPAPNDVSALLELVTQALQRLCSCPEVRPVLVIAMPREHSTTATVEVCSTLPVPGTLMVLARAIELIDKSYPEAPDEAQSASPPPH